VFDALRLRRSSVEEAAEREREFLDVVWRASVMRKAGLLPVLLAESGKIYVAEEGPDVWGSKRRVSVEQLRALVLAAEAIAKVVVAKPVGRETRGGLPGSARVVAG
jgi:hypothetical protein